MEKKPCPVDRGKLITGIEICLGMCCVCSECPYYEKQCPDAILNDALAYIYYLEELLNAKADGSD